MKLKTQSTLSQSGDAVSRTSQGQVVFITGAAPDELVEVSITKSKKSFARAETLKVIEASAERVSPGAIISNIVVAALHSTSLLRRS